MPHTSPSDSCCQTKSQATPWQGLSCCKKENIKKKKQQLSVNKQTEWDWTLFVKRKSKIKVCEVLLCLWLTGCCAGDSGKDGTGPPLSSFLGRSFREGSFTECQFWKWPFSWIWYVTVNVGSHEGCFSEWEFSGKLFLEFVIFLDKMSCLKRKAARSLFPKEESGDLDLRLAWYFPEGRAPSACWSSCWISWWAGWQAGRQA